MEICNGISEKTYETPESFCCNGEISLDMKWNCGFNKVVEQVNVFNHFPVS